MHWEGTVLAPKVNLSLRKLLDLAAYLEKVKGRESCYTKPQGHVQRVPHAEDWQPQ